MKHKTRTGLALLFLSLGIASGCGDDNEPGVEPGPQTGELAAPDITIPEEDPFFSNDDELEIRGTCPEGSTVRLSGAATDETSCSSGEFRFLVRRSVDGSYHFALQARDDGRESEFVTLDWIRDTDDPARPRITQPRSNPFRSREATLELKGRCEPGAKVSTTGAERLQVSCGSDGRFELRLDQRAAGKGTFVYRIAQTDRAGNESAAAVFRWIIDRAAPPIPRITQPDDDPHYTRTGQLTVIGGCECRQDDCVILSGDFDERASCEQNTYRFELSVEREDEYLIEVSQTDGVNRSPKDILHWIYDKTAPDAPSIRRPVAVVPGGSGEHESKDDILLSGRCESMATVLIDDGTQERRAVCANRLYRVKLAAKCGTTTELAISQQDPAGNRSEATRLSWSKNCPANGD